MEEKANRKDSPAPALLKPPPPPPTPVATAENSPAGSPPKLSLDQSPEGKDSAPANEQSGKSESTENQRPQEVEDDDFGDFQAAG